MTASRSPMRGFTLVEVLVAMAVMAIMSLMAWQGVDGIARTNLARLYGDGLRFLNVSVTHDGLVELKLNVRPGVAHRLDASPDLSRWTAVLTNLPSATPWDVRLTNGGVNPRFYRALQLPAP